MRTKGVPFLRKHINYHHSTVPKTQTANKEHIKQYISEREALNYSNVS